MLCFWCVEFDLPTGETNEDRAAASGGTMSCQELLALSGALSAALPTGQVALDSFFEELTKGISKRTGDEKNESKVNIIHKLVQKDPEKNLEIGSYDDFVCLQILDIEDFSCCAELLAAEAAANEAKKGRFSKTFIVYWRKLNKFLSWLRKHIKKIANNKYFQQGN